MRRVGGGASDGGLGRACRISQGCGQGWACRPRGPPRAVIQVHVPPNAPSGKACRPVLPLCRARRLHPATPLSGGTSWPTMPAHLEPCCFSRPHVSAQTGHVGQCCSLAEPCFNTATLAIRSGMQAKFQPCRWSHPQLSGRQGMHTHAASLCSHRCAPVAPRSTRHPHRH